MPIKGAPLLPQNPVVPKFKKRSSMPGFEGKGAPLPRVHKPSDGEHEPSTTVGFESKAVSAVLLGATAGTLLIGSVVASTAHAEELTLDSSDDRPTEADVARLAAELEEKRDELTPAELERARIELWNAYVRAGLSGPMPADDPAEKTRGEARLERLVHDLERAMRVTARDMAYGGFEYIEGSTVYKKISEERVRTLISDALKDIPIGELPGGSSLATIVKTLPGTGGLDVDNMSFNELKDALGDEAKAWLLEKFGPFLKEHKIEAAVVTFGTVTAARWASPEFAGAMDDLAPPVTIWKNEKSVSENGTVGARAELEYRDRHVLPDLNLDAYYTHRLGPKTTARIGGSGTFSVEGETIVDPSVTAGVHHGDGDRWVDLSATARNNDRYDARVIAGMRDRDSGLRVTSNLTARFSDNAAVGDAAGRVHWTVDVHKDLELNGAKGELGFFAGAAIDTDGKNDDVRAGLVFTLKW